MKLLIKDNKIIATATDDYAGSEKTISAPADFDINLNYQIIDGAAVVQACQIITMRQARLVLLAHELLSQVESAIVTAEHKIWWEYSTVVERNHPLVCSALDSLGKSADEIDALFAEAAGL